MFPVSKLSELRLFLSYQKPTTKEWFKNYYHVLADVLNRFVQTFDVNIYIFDQVIGPTPMENDSLASEALLISLGNEQTRIRHIHQQLTPMELKACYGLMDLFIASRFHSGIFAMSTGTPTLFIGYNPKTKGFLKAVSLENLMLDLNKIDEKRLWEILSQIWVDRHTISKQCKAAAVECEKDFDRVSKSIAEDYYKSEKP